MVIEQIIMNIINIISIVYKELLLVPQLCTVLETVIMQGEFLFCESYPNFFFIGGPKKIFLQQNFNFCKTGLSLGSE